MRYLIDTNVLLFYATDSPFLNRNVRVILEDYENTISVCSECVKEAIHLFQTKRVKIEKIKIAHDVIDFIENDLGFTIEYITPKHLLSFAELDLVKDHNDPSDRLIIAQAITEKLPLISSDRKFEGYRQQGLQFIYNKK